MELTRSGFRAVLVRGLAITVQAQIKGGERSSAQEEVFPHVERTDVGCTVLERLSYPRAASRGVLTFKYILLSTGPGRFSTLLFDRTVSLVDAWDGDEVAIFLLVEGIGGRDWRQRRVTSGRKEGAACMGARMRGLSCLSVADLRDAEENICVSCLKDVFLLLTS